MTCSLCPLPVEARGWCSKHYHRWMRHGHPTAGGRWLTVSDVRIDPEPLLTAIDQAIDSRIAEMTEADRRAFYRARQRGWIGDAIADRLACRYLGEPLETIYGQLEAV